MNQSTHIVVTNVITILRVVVIIGTIDVFVDLELTESSITNQMVYKYKCYSFS